MLAKVTKIIFVFFTLIFISQGYAHASLNKEVHTLHHYHFSVPLGLEPKVNFWKKIYSEYSADHFVVHDMDNLDIVYEVVYIKNASKMSRRAREYRLKRVKRKYQKLLLQIARTKNPRTLKADAKRVYRLVKSDFRKASRRIRVQFGQKDQFLAGLERSGRFKNRIKQILSDAKLPLELGILPHVESSFQINAYSSAGAAGIWQFTRGTGRLFMKVGYDVDERRDPILSTVAAAKLLKANFEALQSWPLAVTAYNHGTQGMKNAKKRHGGNIVDIINGYRSRTFGFASKNFYSEFLAALHVVDNKDKYFPGTRFDKPQNLSSVVFKDFVHINSVMSHLKMTRNEIAKYNPALRRPVISGQKRIPRNFTFQAPKNKLSQHQAFYKIIPARERYTKQLRSKWYTVRRGDTLSGVASRFRTSVNKLHRYNNLSHKNKIYIGQVLRLPGRVSPIGSVVRSAKGRKARKNYSGETMVYRVRRNDNLTKIANRFDTEVSELIRLNKMKHPDQIYPGQRLKVPRKITLAQVFKKTPAPKIAPINNKKERVGSKPDSADLGKLATQNLKTQEFEVRLANHEAIDQVNRKRPAFLPVSFFGKATNLSKIGVITVDFDETISHYAEWSKLPLGEILSLNGLRNQSRLNVHAKIKVPFKNVDPDVFEERRQEYHKAIQEDFFNNFKVNKLLVRNVSKGETVWELCNEIYSIPFWLLASYNPGKDINSISVGEPIVVPIISPVNSG